MGYLGKRKEGHMAAEINLKGIRLYRSKVHQER